MPASYPSLFDKAIVTKKDMCELLNLDTSREGLQFSRAEIERAYRIRSVRFHPDRQRYYDAPISNDMCTVLMSDISLAKDYLLDNKEYIFGKGAKDTYDESHDLVEVAIVLLNSLRTSASILENAVDWIDFLSNEYLMIGFLSTFIGGELSINYLNLFSKEIKSIQSYLEGVDGQTLITFLRTMKENLNNTQDLNIDGFIEQLKVHLPDSITQHEHFEQLCMELKGTASALNDLLKGNFIDQLEDILKFWPNFITTAPSWKLIMGVYFISLIGTSNSLPKLFYTLRVLSELILEYKGILPLILLALPLTVLTALLLPINFIIQFGIDLGAIAFGNAVSLVVNAVRASVSIASMLILPLFGMTEGFVNHAINLLYSIVNLFVLLPLNVVLGTLNSLLFIITDKSLLTDSINTMNGAFQSLFESSSSEEKEAFESSSSSSSSSSTSTSSDEEDEFESSSSEEGYESDSSSSEEDETKETNTELMVLPGRVHNEPRGEVRFFATTNLPLHNKEDTWLNKLLHKITEHTEEEHQTPACN